MSAKKQATRNERNWLRQWRDKALRKTEAHPSQWRAAARYIARGLMVVTPEYGHPVARLTAAGLLEIKPRRPGPPIGDGAEPLRFAGDYRIHPSAHPAVKMIFDEVKRRNMSMRYACMKAGVDDNTVRDWARKARSPGLFEFEAVVNSLGYDIQFVKKEERRAG